MYIFYLLEQGGLRSGCNPCHIYTTQEPKLFMIVKFSSQTAFLPPCTSLLDTNHVTCRCFCGDSFMTKVTTNRSGRPSVAATKEHRSAGTQTSSASTDTNLSFSTASAAPSDHRSPFLYGLGSFYDNRSPSLHGSDSVSVDVLFVSPPLCVRQQMSTPPMRTLTHVE